MHGLVYVVDGIVRAVPIVRVEIHASVLNISAQVHVEQEYKNDSSATAECSYRFPVPARASVCAFSLRKEDGSKVVGVVREKEKARAEYDQAIAQGQLVSLMEQDTPDAFTTSVGNILPGETVVVELTYVTELTDGETNDSIRFHIPAHVGCRYGDEPSTSKASGLVSTSKTFLTVDVKLEAAAPISKVYCPSHAVSTDLGPDPSLPNVADLPWANYARVGCRSDLALSCDFVLEITSAGLDRPRCMFERHPTADSVAVSLTVVPRFQLPEVKGQEYVFLVDRSGSMGDWGSQTGGRIALARKALVVLLRSLPHRDTTFNIVSFGSSHDVLWKQGSRAYNQNTLDEATRLVDSMEANLGGTEIRAALEAVFQVRDPKRPTSIFVLTDGDAWDLGGVLEAVKTAVSSAVPTAPLRIFSLGIGNSASTAMVDGLARVGHGIAQYVSDGENYTGKTARLLKAARSPPILNARLDFGVDPKTEHTAQGGADDEFELVDAPKKQEAATLEKKEGESSARAVNSTTMSFYDDSIDPLANEKEGVPLPEPVTLAPPAPIQLAPHKLHSLYPGSRLNAYGIVTPASLLGDKVTLRGELATGQQLALDIPLVAAQLVAPPGPPPLLHAIAARKLIQELEDGSHVLTPPGTAGDLAARTLKDAVVRLGTQYSLASTHTSFVAVDEAGAKRGKVPKVVAVVPPVVRTGVFGGGPAPGGAPFRSLFRAMAAAPPPPPPAAPLFSMALHAAVPPAPQALRASGMFGAAAVDATPCSRGGGGGGGSFKRGGPPHGVSVSFCAAAPAPAPVLGSAASTPPPAFDSATPAAASLSSSAAPASSHMFGTPAHPAAPLSWLAKKADTAPTPTEEEQAEQHARLSTADRIELLARAQTFSGAFTRAALDALPSSWRSRAPAGSQSAGVSATAAVTLAVLAFLESEAGAEQESWEGMAEKARAWVAEELGVGEDEVDKLIMEYKVCGAGGGERTK